jgi:hypothetical protein
MDRSNVFFVLTAVMLCSAVAAQDSGFGLGVIVGEPTGLSSKLWIGSSTAIDGAVAWSFDEKSVLYLHADYLFHNFNLFEEEGNVPVYFGIGGSVKFEENSKVGVRIPVGIDYILTGAPLDIFLELVPLLDLVPGTEFRFKGAIGIRYFF